MPLETRTKEEYESEETNKLTFDLKGIQQNFGKWLYDWGPFDIGITTRNALDVLSEFLDPAKCR
jgi:hypothetical protein